MLEKIYNEEQKFYYFYDIANELHRIEVTKDENDKFVVGKCYPWIDPINVSFGLDEPWFNQPKWYKNIPVKIVPKKLMVGAAFMNPFNRTIYSVPEPTIALLAHEYRHYEQLMEMKLIKFVFFVGIPSVLSCIFDPQNHFNYAYEQETSGFKKYPFLEKMYIKYKERNK